MSKLLEVLRSRVVQNGAAEMPDSVYALWDLKDAAKKAGLTIQEARAEALTNPDVEYFNTHEVEFVTSVKRRPEKQ